MNIKKISPNQRPRMKINGKLLETNTKEKNKEKSKTMHGC
jgi:hypothetical protein